MKKTKHRFVAFLLTLILVSQSAVIITPGQTLPPSQRQEIAPFSVIASGVLVMNFTDLKDTVNDFNNNATGNRTILIGADFDITENLTVSNPNYVLTITSSGVVRTLTRGYDDLNSSNGLFTVNGSKLVLEDIVLDGDNRINNKAPLVRVAGGAGSALTMNNGAILKNNYATQGGGVYVANSGTFTMIGGEISGNVVSEFGGGVLINNGTFIMNGGAISGNTADIAGGGVRAVSNASFVMNEGKINGNVVDSRDYSGGGRAESGGGVYIGNGTTFTMYGGEISGNTVYGRDDYGTSSANRRGEGSGVFVSGGEAVTVFTMYGGEISGNIARNSIVYVESRATFNMRGGKINNNTTAYNIVNIDGYPATFNMYAGEISGNDFKDYINGSFAIGVVVRVHTSNTTTAFTMHGGKISGNAGSGVYVDSSTFIMNAGEISGNYGAGSGGGVFVSGMWSDGAKFIINGGKITGNIARDGGGVWVNYGTLIMNGGEIVGNTAQNGGGVYVNNGTITLGGTSRILTNTGNYYSHTDSNAPLREENVALKDNTYIALGTGDASPADGMEIWVTKTADDGVITTGSGASTAVAEYFHSDDDGCIVVYENGQLKLLRNMSPSSAVSGAPTVSTVTPPTADSITVNPVTIPVNPGEQTVEYAISISSSAVMPAIGWQDETTFTGLTPATSYKVYARSKANTDYYAGEAKVSAPIFTAAAATIVAIPVANPNPSPGLIFDYFSVTLSCATPGAIIRYTLNGSEPTISSPIFSSPIPVTSTIAIKAKAFLDGEESYTGTYLYTVANKAASPVASINPGIVASGTRVRFTSETTGGAILRYTTDGSEPTANSNEFKTSISITSNTTIKIKAFRNGMIPSDTMTFIYHVKTASPVAVPNPIMGSLLVSSAVRLNTETFEATIRYTTDGSEASESSPIYTQPIVITEPTTIRAKAFKSGLLDSDAALFSYDVKIPAPTASPVSGSAVANGNIVSLYCPVTGTTIRYTTNGAEPDENSPVYSTPIVITARTTIKAKAYKNGWVDSDTAAFLYDVKVLTPSANPRSGSYVADDGAEDSLITLSCNTQNVIIRYTIGASASSTPEPNEENSLIYTSPISLQSSSVIKVKAFKEGFIPSDTAVFSYTVAPRMDAPVASLPSGSVINLNNGDASVTLSCSTPGAIIRYTTNGTEPTANSPGGYAPIEVKVNYPQTIKAKTFFNASYYIPPSHTAAFSYEIGDLETKLFDLGSLIETIPGNVPRIGNDPYNININGIPATVFYDGDDQIKIVIGIGINTTAWGEGMSYDERKQKFENLEKALEANADISLTELELTCGVKPASAITTNMFVKSEDSSTVSRIIGYAKGSITNLASLNGKLRIVYYKDNHIYPPGLLEEFIDGLPLSVTISSALATAAAGPMVSFFVTLGAMVVPKDSHTSDKSDAIDYNGDIKLINMNRIIPLQALTVSSHFYEYDGKKSLLGVIEGGAYRIADLGGEGSKRSWTFGNNSNSYYFEGKYERYWQGTNWFVLKSGKVNKETTTFNLQGYKYTPYLSSIYTTNDMNNNSISSFSNPYNNNHYVIEASIYSQSKPLIAETNNKRVMVFIDNDDTVNDINSAKLVYSIYDANIDKWSNPQLVCSDKTTDFYPSIASDSNNIWVVWHKSKMLFDNNTSLEDMLASAEIAVAQFDNATNTFTDVTVLTDNNYLDTHPRIAVNGNEAFIIWVRNERNDIFGAVSDGNEIIAKKYSGGEWGSEIKLADNVGTIVDMDAGYFGNNARIAYITDSDNDLDTNLDQSLKVIDLAGNVTNTLAAGKSVANPKFTKINGNEVLTWYENEVITVGEESRDGGNIRYITADNQKYSLFDEPDFTINNYKIVCDGAGNTAVIYPYYQDNNGYMLARTRHNGSWGNPFLLAEMGNHFLYYDSILENNGEFSIIYNNRMITIINENNEGDETELVETNDLRVLKAAPTANIWLSNVRWFDEDIRLGQPLPMSVNIVNIGGVPVNSVVIKANGAVVGTFPISGGLLTGGYTTIDFNLNLPSDMPEQTTFEISVEPYGQIDSNMDDNVYTAILGFSNLSLNLNKVYNENGTVSVFANAENISDYDANAKLLVKLAAEDGDVIDFIELGTIAGRENVITEFVYNPDIIVSDGDEYEILFFELISDKEELYTANKSDFIVIFAPHKVQRYTVTVLSAGTGAIGGGDYAQGEFVIVDAGIAPEGMQFKSWTAGPAITFDDENNENTGFIMPDCDVTVTANFEPVSAFVPVADITGVPVATTAGIPLNLTGTVVPSNATNKTIIWSVKQAGATGATVDSNTLYTTAAGSVTVTATIAGGLTISDDYTQDFVITANPIPPATPTIIITTQPAATTNVTAGSITDSLTITAKVSPGGMPAYQWYSNTTESNTGGIIISGETGVSFAIPTTLIPGVYYYYCVVSATGAADVISNVAIVNVTPSSAYGISLNPSGDHAFLSVTPGYSQQTPHSVTINNTGNRPTGALIIALSGANANSFTLNKTNITNIAAGGADIFTVVPKTDLPEGIYYATVTVSGGNGITETFNVRFEINASDSPKIPDDPNSKNNTPNTPAANVVGSSSDRLTAVAIDSYNGNSGNPSGNNGDNSGSNSDSGSGGAGGASGGVTSGGGVINNASLSASGITYDKNSGEDLTIILTSAGYRLRNLKNGEYKLAAGSDYNVSDNEITIKAAYLKTLPPGEQTIVFDMSGGTNPKLIITVKDTRKYAVMQPTKPAGAKVTALPSRNTLVLNGKQTDFPAVNIEDYNWLKLRDVAALLNGTGKQFAVGYDAQANIITITTNKAYAPVGDELNNFFKSPVNAVSSPQKLHMDGQLISVAAYNIEGYNYFRLRDIAILLDFYIIYDKKSETITLDLSNPYSE